MINQPKTSSPKPRGRTAKNLTVPYLQHQRWGYHEDIMGLSSATENCSELNHLHVAHMCFFEKIAESQRNHGKKQPQGDTEQTLS